VDDLSTDDAPLRQREVDVLERQPIHDLQRFPLLERTALTVVERNVPAARDANRVAARGQFGELVASVHAGARRPLIAAKLRRSRGDARAPQRTSGVGGEDASADHGGARRDGRTIARWRAGPRRSLYSRWWAWRRLTGLRRDHGGAHQTHDRARWEGAGPRRLQQPPAGGGGGGRGGGGGGGRGR